MSEKDENKTTVVALPATLTDFATALEKIMDVIAKAAGGVEVVSEAIQRSKGKKAAGALDAIAFKSDGSRRHLENIAAGKGQLADIEAIATVMNRTGGSVEDAIDLLDNNRKFIRERFGMDVANRIGELIYAGGGKASIRWDLQALVGMDDAFYAPEAVAEEAERILRNIHKMNAALVELHDILVQLKDR